MAKITISEMSFYYEDYYYPIFEQVNLIMDTDWRLGLIGRNGRGKTTLLRLLTGELEPTSGHISLPVQVSYFPYQEDTKYGNTLELMKENIGGLKTMEDAMEEIIASGQEERFMEYSQIQDEYLQAGGYEVESRIRTELSEMALDGELLNRPFDTLSGGEKARIMIIILFLRREGFILLDEPTNHLDIAGIEAVAAYLERKSGFIVVSHDRSFLDRVADHILAINKQNIEIEQGNYSSWKYNKDVKEEYETRTRERLAREVMQLERLAEVNRKWAAAGNKQKYAFKTNARANGAKAYMHQAKRSEERIQDNLEAKKQLLQNYEEAKEMSICQEKPTEEGWLVRISKLWFAYPPSGRELFDGRSFKVYPGDRIWLKGRNGAGKSTLLKLIQGLIEYEGMERAENLEISAALQEPLWQKDLLTAWFQRAGWEQQKERFLSLCDSFDLPEDLLKRPLQTFSSGEKRKIDIARALAEDNRLLILDEPLNYMDVLFREQLEGAILRDEPTLIFVEHDARFGERVATETVEL